MTHEELLLEIDQLNHSCSVVDIVAIALRAVVELHRPEQQEHGKYKFTEKCWNCNLVYPCPTIQAIERGLSA